MVALHETLSCEVRLKRLAFCNQERFLWISIFKSLPSLTMLRHMNMEGCMDIQKVNLPSVGRFQPLFTPQTVIEFFLQSLKGNIGLVPNSEGLWKLIIELSNEF